MYHPRNQRSCHEIVDVVEDNVHVNDVDDDDVDDVRGNVVFDTDVD